MCLNCYVQRDPGGSTGQCRDKQRDELFGVTAHISPCTGIQFPTMSVVSRPGDVRRAAEPDPHIVELGNLMLARAAELGGALADRLFRDVDFYRDGSIVTKDEVRATCEANLMFVFDSLAAHTDVDVSPAQQTGTTRALAGVPLPALMTAYRIGFRFMWEETLAVARSAGIPTESILNATARVFLAQDTFTQAMADAYRQQLTAQIVEQEEERSALVEALLSRRITDTQSLWEAADLLRLPTTGPYVVVAAQLPAIGKLALPAIENKLAARDIRSAWRLLPDLHIGLVQVRIPEALDRLIDVLGQAATVRVGVSPPFQDLADTSDALRFARLAVTGKPSAESHGHRVRRHPTCRRGGERARGHDKDQVISAQGTERTADPSNARS